MIPASAGIWTEDGETLDSFPVGVGTAGLSEGGGVGGGAASGSLVVPSEEIFSSVVVPANLSVNSVQGWVNVPCQPNAGILQQSSGAFFSIHP